MTGPNPKEHAAVAAMRWVVFLCLAALMLGAVAAAIVAVWRWIF